MKLDAQAIQQQIANLLLQYSELNDDEVLRADMVEGSTDAHEFLRLVERKRQEAAVMAGALASNIAEMELRQGRFERREKAMRELAFKVMEAADLRKVELPECTMSIVTGKPKVLIFDVTELPEDYFRIKKEPDKTKIKSYLDAGQEVPGAGLSNAEPHLTIKIK